MVRFDDHPALPCLSIAEQGFGRKEKVAGNGEYNRGRVRPKRFESPGHFQPQPDPQHPVGILSFAEFFHRHGVR